MITSSTPPESLQRRLAEITVERRDIFDVQKYPFESPEAKAKINELNGEARRIKRHLKALGVSLAPKPKPQPQPQYEPALQSGDQVSHPEWGRGEVIGLQWSTKLRATIYGVRYESGEVHYSQGGDLKKESAS